MKLSTLLVRHTPSTGIVVDFDGTIHKCKCIHVQYMYQHVHVSAPKANSTLMLPLVNPSQMVAIYVWHTVSADELMTLLPVQLHSFSCDNRRFISRRNKTSL